MEEWYLASFMRWSRGFESRRRYSMTDLLRRRFFGTCAILLGAWETAAYAGRAPTITDTVRRYGWLRMLTAFWLAGLARHLLGR